MVAVIHNMTLPDKMRSRMNETLVAIHDYYKAFSTLELDACAPFFALPCMFIGLQGTFVGANREDLARGLGPIIEALRTKDY